jgi:transposase
MFVELILGIDLACRAAHQASLARPDGTLVWTGRKFFTRPAELEKLWADIGLGVQDTLRVVMEPTRNVWAPVASWFRHRGARISMVPTTQSADLRAYYSKHTKNDHLDSKLLARLPLPHPEGLREHTGDGPAEPLRRLVKIRSSIVKRRTAVFQRLDAQLELLGPAWYDALGSNYGKAALALLARYADPHSLTRLGHARLTRFLIRHSRGAWREHHATMLLTAAAESLQLWGSGDQARIDFAELAADIAVEAEQAQVLTEQIEDLDERSANLYAEADPTGIIASAPGVGPVTCAVIAGRIGDPHRFHSLAAIRAYSGLVPKVNQSGQAEHHDRLKGRRRTATRSPLRCRRPGPQNRPATRCKVQAAHGQRTPPRLGDLLHRHHPAHPNRHLLAHRPALRPARHRRPPHHPRRRTPHRAHPPCSRQTDPHQGRQHPPAPAPQRQDGPGTTGVAKRSSPPTRQHEHKEP